MQNDTKSGNPLCKEDIESEPKEWPDLSYEYIKHNEAIL